ncbi:hypothetical protein EON64_05685 [archaeon]|nr:MAG: hypothetical protein EON64_05685 [archaeon]
MCTIFMLTYDLEMCPLFCRTIQGKMQLVVQAFARALEVVPKNVADNAGIDSIDVLNKLRKEHAQNKPEGRWIGVDVLNEGICDTLQAGVWEPAANKSNALAAASEAACLILSIDETVRNPQSEKPGAPSQGVGLGPGGGGGGRGTRKMVSEAMGGKGMSGMMGTKGVNSFKGRGGG